MNSILNKTIKESVLRNSAILLFFFLGCINIMAQEEVRESYIPFVEEGKTWYCGYDHPKVYFTPTLEDPEGRGIDCIFTMRGDTLINNTEYKKVHCQFGEYYGDEEQHYYCAVREEAYQVFIIEEDSVEEKLLYDFRHPKNNIILTSNGYKYGRTSGKHRSKYLPGQLEFNICGLIDNELDLIHSSDCWIDGVGNPLNNPFAIEYNFLPDYNPKLGTYLYLRSCIKDGEYVLDNDWRSSYVENPSIVKIDGLKYYLYPETHEAALDNNNTWSGELDIPSEVNYEGNTYTVTGIAWAAFDECIELTKVRIPKTIKKIINHSLSAKRAVSPDYKNPFVRCSSLESIEVDEENQDFKSIDGVLFSKDGTQLCGYPSGIKAESYTIPEGVTWIGGSAFESNEHLTSIVLPATIEKLCENALYACFYLKVIDIPESVTKIGNYAFDNCFPDALIIRGILNNLDSDLFEGLGEATKIYVPSAELERYKNKYNREFFPLEDYTTGVQETKSLSDMPSPMYDLSGKTYHRTNAKGIYIQNGKKIVK